MNVFEQITGNWFDGHYALLATGYSGSPEGKNDPTKQNVPNVGPVPQGEYTIGAPFDDPHHGPYCLRLTPNPVNQMFGRAGFLIHGDSIEHPGCASEGCIILPRNVREMIVASNDEMLRVVSGEIN